MINRKDLDDIAFRTHRSLLLCRRVFDNMKRITKKVEDAEEEMVPCIMNHFLLSQELACQYAHIIFMNHYRFDTTKRKLSLLGFADYEYGTFLSLEKNPPSSPELDQKQITVSFLCIYRILTNHTSIIQLLPFFCNTFPHRHLLPWRNWILRSLKIPGSSKSLYLITRMYWKSCVLPSCSNFNRKECRLDERRVEGNMRLLKSALSRYLRL